MKSQKMRDSARNEQCTVNLVGVCNYDPSTTILAHLPDESNGMGKKADDLSACYACSACHDAIDSRIKWPESESEHREWYYRRALIRTWRRMVELGIIAIKGLKP
jgi:L-lactate utilization protein LutB